jgi:hypothetical protein
MRKTVGLLCAGVLLVTSVKPAVAQDAGDVAAYLAMVFTPIGALPPQITPSMAGLTQTRARVRVQYGRFSFTDDVGYNNLGVGIDVGRGRGSMGLTLGYGFDDCEGDCDGVIMLGGHIEGRLASSSLGDTPDGARLNMGIRGDLGFSRMDDVTSFTGVVGVPVALSAPSGGIRFVPFLTPAFGFGRLSGDDDSESGVRFLLGGGVGVVSATQLMINFGFQKVLIEDGDTMFGIGVAWNVGR